MRYGRNALRRRVEKLGRELAQKRVQEDWRGSPEDRRRIWIGRQLSFAQTCFLFGGFYDLARRWGYLASLHSADPDESMGHLLEQVGLWARSFKATPDERNRALEDTRRGLRDRFNSEEEWSRYWWAGPSPNGSVHGNSPSGYRFDQWLATNPPRWEIACAVWLSKVNPQSKHYSKTHPANPLRQDIGDVDRHFRGPRTRRHEAELKRVREELGQRV